MGQTDFNLVSWKKRRGSQERNRSGNRLPRAVFELDAISPHYLTCVEGVAGSVEALIGADSTLSEAFHIRTNRGGARGGE